MGGGSVYQVCAGGGPTISAGRAGRAGITSQAVFRSWPKNPDGRDVAVEAADTTLISRAETALPNGPGRTEAKRTTSPR